MRKPCHLPVCFAPGMTYSTLQAFPLSCVLITSFSAGFQEPPQQGVWPISWGFARIVNSISQEISYPASHSTSLDRAPLKFRLQGKAPGPWPYMLANSCQSLSLRSLSSLITPARLHWVVLGFNPGYHPGSRERKKWGTPKGRHCCLWEKGFYSVSRYSRSADLGGKVEPPLSAWRMGGGQGWGDSYRANIHRAFIQMSPSRVSESQVFSNRALTFVRQTCFGSACKHLQLLCLQPAASLSAPPLLERRAPLQVTTEAPKLSG